MKRIAFILYILMVVCLGAATFIEKYQGTQTASEQVYGSLWFVIFWILIAISSFVYLYKQKSYKRKAAFLLHLSFGVILAGAGITHFTGKQGMIHLRQGETNRLFTDADTHEVVSLPFVLGLDTFRIVCYPGTEAPSDYISSVYADKSVSGDISMNKIFSYRGYRFYQSSFDEDYRGSWLSVNYDPWGISVTYSGYILLVIAMLCVLIAPDGGFRKLLSHPLLKQAGVMALLLCSSATASAQHVLSHQQAATYSTKQIIYNDRVAPFNTLARDFVMKLTGKSTYKDLTPEQVLTGWMFYPETWQNEPMIRIKSEELQQLLGVGEYTCLTDFFTNKKEYRLQTYWNKLHQSGKQNSLLKAITETDEKIAIIAMLQQKTLIRPVPDKGVQRLSDLKVQAELLYNKIPFATLLYRVNLTLGLIAFLLFSIRQIQPSSLKKMIRIAAWMLFISFLFHTIAICLRTYIAGRFPLSNGYETMQFTAWCAMLLALLLRRRFPLTIVFGFLLSGFTLLVASLVQMNPQITPLMPVLSSPLLSLHVSFIMMSYSLLGFMFFNGITALFTIYRQKSGTQNEEQIERLTLLSRLLLYPATFLLGIGIFIGAIWANVSWGRYWAWDPKEVWALITFMVYGMAFHVQSLKAFQRPTFFHLFLVIGILTVLMTYFGVNYFLGGMHSYANA